MSFVYIGVAVVLGTAAQLFLKAGTNAAPVDFRLAFEPRILAGIACYAVSLVVWILALSKTPVSVAYPMVSIGFALNAALPGGCSARRSRRCACWVSGSSSPE